jgi:hypothetical protein
MLASQLIGRIEDVRAAAGAQEPKYLEVVGFRERPASLLMPKAETFGASFFEWDMGDAWRIISFLKTLGYYPNVRALPAAQRGLLLEMAGAMPRWPAHGSIALDGDIVIVKFGDYSSTQKKEICAATGRPEFCW